MANLLHSQLFQSTLPRGSDDTDQPDAQLPCHISIHAPSRERPMLFSKPLRYAAYFNPRSLAGATIALFTAINSRLFQSTLPRGSDPIFGCSYLCYFVFQSTLPRGSDPIIRNSERFAGIISIHAPSRERLHINKIILHSKHFNPRSLAGATLPSPVKPRYKALFQSTLPRGSDEAQACFSIEK